MNDTIKAGWLGCSIQVAAASVIGRDHLRVGKNNQDALAIWRGRDHLCAVVADGCGSSPHSEVGAQLGARLLAHALSRRLEGDGAIELAALLGRHDAGSPLVIVLEEIRQELLAELAPIALSLAGRGSADDPRMFAAAVRDYLLFTLVAAVVGPSGSLLFSIGDGVAGLNGDTTELGPFPGNEPPYLGYALLPETLHGFPEASLRFQIRGSAKPEESTALAIGTDGASDLFSAFPLAVLASSDPLFANPDALRRKLWLLAQRKPGDGNSRALRDDTTLVLVRATAAGTARIDPRGGEERKA